MGSVSFGGLAAWRWRPRTALYLGGACSTGEGAWLHGAWCLCSVGGAGCSSRLHGVHGPRDGESGQILEHNPRGVGVGSKALGSRLCSCGRGRAAWRAAEPKVHMHPDRFPAGTPGSQVSHALNPLDLYPHRDHRQRRLPCRVTALLSSNFMRTRNVHSVHRGTGPLL